MIDDKNTKLDNTNVQDYLTTGFALLGNLKFEVAVSGHQCRLDVSLYGRFFVNAAEQQEDGCAQDNESVDAFASRYASITESITKLSISDYDEEEEE